VCDKAFCAEQCDELLISEQAAQGIHEKQQTALSDRRFLDQYSLPFSGAKEKRPALDVSGRGARSGLAAPARHCGG
jgi:hypothetical protein